MEKLLSIVVTHWKEPWEEIQHYFLMVNLQRGVDPDECEVIIVQDGDDNGGVNLEAIRENCQFPCKVIRIQHGGVSKARNAGMDAATGKMVMFCDSDDCLYSVDSLRTLLDSIGEVGDRADIIWAPFWMEMKSGKEGWHRQIEGRNWVFIHAKMWKTAWLREKRIRFDERLAYSEDVLFNTEATLETDTSRIAYLKEPVYVWCKRATSCTENRENEKRNRRHAYLCREYRADACARRGKPYEAMTHALRGMLDGYYELTGGSLDEDERSELEEIVATGLIRRWFRKIRVTKEDMNELGLVARRSAIQKHMYPTRGDKIDAEPEGEEKNWEDMGRFVKWVEEIGQKHQVWR